MLFLYFQGNLTKDFTKLCHPGLAARLWVHLARIIQLLSILASAIDTNVTKDMRHTSMIDILSQKRRLQDAFRAFGSENLTHPRHFDCVAECILDKRNRKK